MKRIKRRMKVILAVFVLISVLTMDISYAYADVTESIEKTEETWKEDGVLKILMIGHSFSRDTLQYIYQFVRIWESAI